MQRGRGGRAGCSTSTGELQLIKAHSTSYLLSLALAAWSIAVPLRNAQQLRLLASLDVPRRPPASPAHSRYHRRLFCFLLHLALLSISRARRFPPSARRTPSGPGWRSSSEEGVWLRSNRGAESRSQSAKGGRRASDDPKARGGRRRLLFENSARRLRSGRAVRVLKYGTSYTLLLVSA